MRHDQWSPRTPMTNPILRLLLSRQFRDHSIHLYITLPDESEICVSLTGDRGEPVPGLPGVRYEATLSSSAAVRPA